MRRPPISAALLAAVLAILPLASTVQAQATSAPVAATASIDDLLRRGTLLEADHRWGEALTLYEEALRQFHGVAGGGNLKQRFDLARMHYELCRRYNDRSFRDVIAKMPPKEALDLYGDVLLKLQSHYVDMPKWKELVESGTRAFEVATTEKPFLDANPMSVSGTSVEAFRRELREAIGSRVVANRSDAASAVAMAANLAHERLGISPAALILEYTCGAISVLDQYSSYLTPDQLNEVYSQIEGNFVGLGVELKAQEGTLVIVRVIPNSPAKRGGVRDGDRILAVNGQSTQNLTTDQAANLLQGEVGTVARMVLAASGESPREVSIRRERVDVPSVDDVKIVDPNQGIAYLKMVCFQKTTFRDLDNALWSLHRAGMRKLIIDLRGNPGGLLIAAVEAADLFLDQGVIVSTRGRNSHEDFTYSAREVGTWHVPLVLLIDQDSASAAEIFAGAIRDHHRGTIVGKRSYGKGSVQGIFPLSVGSSGLRLTTAKFYSPTGQPYSGVGVAPDITPHQTARPAGQTVVPPDQDPAMTAALQAAMQTIAQRQ